MQRGRNGSPGLWVGGITLIGMYYLAGENVTFWGVAVPVIVYFVVDAIFGWRPVQVPDIKERTVYTKDDDE